MKINQQPWSELMKSIQYKTRTYLLGIIVFSTLLAFFPMTSAQCTDQQAPHPFSTSTIVQSFQVPITQISINSTLYINVSNTSFSQETTGCSYVNLSGTLNDIQNVRVNISWNPNIVNVTSVKYNTKLRPMTMQSDENYRVGYLNSHLYNLSGASGVNLNGEVELFTLCFTSVESQNTGTEHCCDINLEEHELTTGDHEDIICTPTNATICYTVEPNENQEPTDTSNQIHNEPADEDTENPLFLFMLIVSVISIIGISAIIIIIKK